MGRRGRYELKYVLDEQRAAAVARFAGMYLRPSSYNRAGSDRGYPVISLYLDSRDFRFYRQAATGLKNRIKLRIRFYDGDWDHPAFLEVKRRVNDVICKDRAMITREGVRKFLSEGWPTPSHWPDFSTLVPGKSRPDAYNLFWSLANRVRAQGIVYVSYMRQAFESPDDEELRVTFDRQVSATVYDGTGRLTVPNRGMRMTFGQVPYCLPRSAVILELKFNERAPAWMFEMVRLFNLERQAVCKYCECIGSMGLPWGGRARESQEVPLMLEAIG